MLYSQDRLEIMSDPPVWHQEVLEDLKQRLKPPSDFPCTYSQNAFSRKLVQFSFIEKADDVAQAAADIAEYLAEAGKWDGKVNTAKPLVMAFSQNAVHSDDLAGYHAFGWAFLQALHAQDAAPWPDGVARDPSHPYWSYCLGGVQLFINMSAPVHKHRQSRNLGRHFLFIINPRERFDVVAGDTVEGNRIRGIIRKRAEAYDGLPHAKVLGSYVKGELEWPQYALPDTNDAFPTECPFKPRPTFPE